MKRRLVVLLLVAGCAGPVAQLDRFKTAEAGGDSGKIVAEAIDGDCDGRPGQSEACPQLQAIRGRACLIQARAAAAPGAACPPPGQRSNLQCAATSFAAARAGGYTPANPGNFAEQHARSLYCLANLTEGAEGVGLSQQAMRQLSAVPSDPGRDLLAASSALHIARADAADAGQRCNAAKDAARIAARGLATTPPGALADGLRSVRFNANAAARSLPDCGGT